MIETLPNASPQAPSSTPPSDSATELSTILVVDDQAPNRQLLEELLEPHGYQLVLCSSGEDALRRLGEHSIDLVLLDISMPGMDGLEVCRRIRADPALASLPVIMVTALAHRQQQLEGISAGASDYLTKPIDSANLLLRVRNALQLRRLHSRLASQLLQLQTLETLRDALVHMLVHDLRAPLQSMVFGLEFSVERARELQETQLLEDLESVTASATLMAGMVSDVLDVSRFEEQAMPLRPVAFDLEVVAREAVASVAAFPAARVTFTGAAGPWMVHADMDVIRRVIANLVANACKFSATGGAVHIEMLQVLDMVELRVIDSGPGIAPADHHLIFEKFGQVAGSPNSGRRSSGLGLTFCKLGVEANGGTIGMESALGQGSTFWFRLPADAGSEDCDIAIF